MQQTTHPVQAAAERGRDRLSVGERTYVLDTSVLLSDPRALLRFAEHG